MDHGPRADCEFRMGNNVITVSTIVTVSKSNTVVDSDCEVDLMGPGTTLQLANNPLKTPHPPPPPLQASGSRQQAARSGRKLLVNVLAWLTVNGMKCENMQFRMLCCQLSAEY
jgi:hypothetical protein